MLKPDRVTESVLSYFQNRGYLHENSNYTHPLTVTQEESSRYDDALRACSKKNSISYTTTVRDIAQAEYQFSLLKSWVRSLREHQVRVELTQLIMPILCHLYLDSLALHSKASCAKFLKKMLPPMNNDWLPLVEQLLTVHNSEDLASHPQVWYFRHCKCDLKLSPCSISALRTFLTKNSLHILIPPLHSYFDVTILTEDVLNNETDTDEETSKSTVETIYGDGFYVPYKDKTMEELLREINNKRMQSTPPPPLLVYRGHKAEGIVCGRVSSEGRLAATGDHKSQVRVWGLGETKLMPKLHPSYFSSVQLAVDTKLIDESLAQIEKQNWFLRGHSDTVYDLSFISDTEFLVSVSFDTTMRLWSLNDFSCTAVYRGHSSPIWGVAISPISNYVATASQDKTARVWSLEMTYPLRIMAGHLNDVTCVKFHPNGSYIATGSVDKTVRLWSVTDGNMVRVMGSLQNQGAVYSLAFSPNGQYLASGGDDKSVWIWDIATGSVLFQLAGQEKRVVSVDWSHDGSTVAAACYDGVVLLWSLDNEQACTGDITSKTYHTKCSTLLSLQYSQKNTLVAVGVQK